MQKIHFAVNDDGFIFLGPSENIGVLKDVMKEADRKWKIFKCISKTKVADLEAFANPFEKAFQTSAFTSAKSKNALNNLAEIFKETLLEEYDYAGIFVDKDFEVKQAIGNFKKFLDFPEGTFNFNLLKMVPTDLSIALSTGIRRAIKDNERYVQRNVKVKADRVERSVTIIIKPYTVQKTYLQPFVFIVLKEEALPQKKAADLQAGEDVSGYRVAEIEQELRDTKENLQALVEEIESANEELQSSNEEIVSSNEELQSTNEELQSLNEELHTVNTEHQQKIKELIELNDDLNNYFKNTDVGQILIDRKLIIRKFSPVATKQVNLIQSDIGRSIADISNNIKNLNFINDIKAVLQTEKTVEKEISVGDGNIYLMRIAPYLRHNKVADGVVVNFIDVTEIKKLNNILEAVFNSSTSGIMALKAIRNEQNAIVDFEFISENIAARALLGTEEGLVGRSFREVYGHVDAKVFDTYTTVVEGGQTTSFEFLNPKNGRWFEIVAVKMMDGLVITFTDITDRKTATEKIARGYEDLKLTSQELEHTNYKLEQSNLDLMQFASVASHDLKEPLRKIQAFGNLLKEKVKTKLDGAETNYLNKVINSASRMQVLIDDILTLSRLSKLDAARKDVNLNELLRQIKEDLEVSINEKGAQLLIHQLPTVKAIPGQMHQLFQNLVSNAIKFNEGQPLITIQEEKVSEALAKDLSIDATEYIGISIQDNGIGFDESFSEKIFGIFQRLEKTSYQGTGIGLAIVKKIIDNHKGYIKATSTPGQGSRFDILLPVKS